IYNLARVGPYVASTYNPLVELSWRDVEMVYNFSAGSLKDMAKQIKEPALRREPADMSRTTKPAASITLPPGTPAITPPPNAAQPTQQPEPNGHEQLQDDVEGMADDYVYSEPLMDTGYEDLAHTEAIFNSTGSGDSLTRVYDERAVADLRATGDRLQAFTDPRDLSETEAVVDLDALDIFDDLDDYVDLDKINIIDDVQVPPTTDQKHAGDELRELIKGRIKQAAEMPGEGGSSTVNLGQSAASAAAQAAEAAKAASARNKFVGGKAAQQEPTPAPAASSAAPPPQPAMSIRNLPQDIRKSCMILGIRPEEMTRAIVLEAWKKQIATGGVHPDLGGDTEAAIYLNTAKDTLVRFLDQQAPKLGKKFGKPQPQPQPQPPKPQPGDSDPNAPQQ
ncbi:MAG: hypothetical protein ACRD3W_30925, partial [Terriglobales bacterium]